MYKFEEWFKDPNYALAYAEQGILMSFWEGLLEQMANQGVTPHDLADQMGVDPEVLRQCMAGDREVTLRQAAEMAHRIQCRIDLQITPTASRGFLIAFEGLDGVGKTTQRNLLAKALQARGISCICTAEPTQGVWGQKIREFSRFTRLTAQEELDLFILDRKNHIKNLIAPALQAKKVVLTDRYFFSSVAYQGSRGLSPQDILQQHHFCPVPDLVFLVDIPAEICMQRILQRSSPPDQFEVLDSLQKCRTIFLEIATDRFVVLDGSLDVQEIHARVLARTLQLFFESSPPGCEKICAARRALT